MSFFPDLDLTDEVVDVIDLVSIDTADGLFRFMLGDGKFTDRDGNDWWGSSLVEMNDMEMSIGGVAPSGSLTLSFFQDPDAGELISDVRALGLDYVEGRAVTFWVQPLRSPEEFWAPTLAMQRLATRTATGLVTSMDGPMQRSITLEFEGPFSGRNTGMRRQYTTTDHALITGAANPSLEFAPKDRNQPEKLFG